MPDILATDLDGTFIPLADSPENVAALNELRSFFHQSNATLVFATGRHFELVQQAIAEHDLPPPDWIICDVGATIRRRLANGEYEVMQAYEQKLASIVGDKNTQHLRARLNTVTNIQLQEEEKQGRFKLSYYVHESHLQQSVDQISELIAAEKFPYSLIQSVDPFTNSGLIDLLPRNVSKAFALKWWSTFNELRASSIIFAGDSGNDIAAFFAGYLAIVVANADRKIAEQVKDHFALQGWQERLCLAEKTATSGVLQGCRQFGLISEA